MTTETLVPDKVERATPKNAPSPQSIRTPPYLQRQLFTPWTSSQFTAERWRNLVGSAPIVRSCVKTLVMLVTGLNWHLLGDDQDAVDYFTDILETADEGEGFEVHTSRVIDDLLTVPFGGAVEIGAYPDGLVAWLLHLDGATMVPTYDPNITYVPV